MTTLRAARFHVAVLATLAVSSLAFAQAPKDEEVAQAVSRYQRMLYRPGPDIAAAEAERTRVADLMLERFGINRLSAQQLLRLQAGMVVSFSSHKAAVVERLESMAKGRDVDGAVATIALIGLHPRKAKRGPESIEDVRAALEHPGIRGALTTEAAEHFVNSLYLVLRQREDAAGLLTRDLANVFDADLPLAVVKSMTILIDALEQSAVPKDALEPVRLSMLGAIKRWRTKLGDDRAVIDYSVSMGNARSGIDAGTIQTTRAYLAGALDQHARKLEGSFGGRVVGKPAPELSIRWAAWRDGGSEIGDFKGRIVVLVHWYRWPGGEASAGLCKELADRYAGKPVEVIAVTTFLAGALHGNGAVIDPGGTRDQQAAAVRAAAAAAGLTMPVGFADSHGLSTMYGIRMSGQVAVIDAAGIVRGVGMSGDDQGKRAIFELIDGLLKEPTAAEPARTAPEPEARPR